MDEHALSVVADLFGHVPAQTQCDYCGRVIALADVVARKVMINDIAIDVEHYCSTEHAKKGHAFKADNE